MKRNILKKPAIIMKKLRGKMIILVLVPVAIIVSAIACFRILGSITVFPNSLVSVSAYDDHQDYFTTGRSVIERFERRPDSVVMSYTLRKGTKYPYAGLVLVPEYYIRQFLDYVDFSGYDRFRVVIRSEKSRTLRLHVHSYVRGFSDHQHPIRFLILYREIPVWRNAGEYVLKFDDFEIPEWWFEMNGLRENDGRIGRDFSRVAEIRIERDGSVPLDVTDTIVLEKIVVERSPGVFACATGMILLLYYGAYFVSAARGRSRGSVIRYRSLPVGNRADEEETAVLTYIDAHYKEPDLTMGMVSHGCGVPEWRIGLALKKKTGLSFPQYLNSLRFDEAKRLLSGTDMSVTDIAMVTGFNNVSYFNNAFRRYAQCSPGAYRKRTEG